jgi:hypothetical protein
MKNGSLGEFHLKKSRPPPPRYSTCVDCGPTVAWPIIIDSEYCSMKK